MSPLVENVTYLLSIGVILTQIFSLVVLVPLIAKRDISFLNKAALPIVFAISLGSMLASLFYSLTAGFAPCDLCWYQRICMYPIALILAVAFFKKDKKNAVDYVLWLSIIGACIAGFHYYGQMFNASVLPCATPGGTSACAVRPFVDFGYITIPMMAFAGFVLNTLLCIYYKVNKKD